MNTHRIDTQLCMHMPHNTFWACLSFSKRSLNFVSLYATVSVCKTHANADAPALPYNQEDTVKAINKERTT